MKIAVLNYTIGEVEIFDAPDMETCEEVEEYLENVMNYRLKDIHYMAGVTKVTM